VIARANDITRSSAHASVETPSIRGCKRYRAMTTRQSVESNRIETKEKQPGRMKKNVGTLSLGRRAARRDIARRQNDVEDDDAVRHLMFHERNAPTREVRASAAD